MSYKIVNFALFNPISVLTNKAKYDWTREDLINVIQRKNIERITFNYTGLDGQIKELKIPVTNRKQAELILAEGERCDGSNLFKGMVEAGKSDLYVVPVYKTAFLNPFDDKSLNIICRFSDRTGNPAEFAPDNILAKASQNLKNNTGFELNSYGELEFYLIGNIENQTYTMPKQKGYHASSPYTKTGYILNEIIKLLSQITGNIKYAHNEVGYIHKLDSEFAELNGKTAEQVEIELSPTPIDEAADLTILAMWLIKNIAYRHNFIASFAPKIELEHAGNGLYFHNALMKNGINVMTDAKGDLTLEAKQLIGGLCHYAPSLTSFGNMCSSSYLRLAPNQNIPTKVCWSNSNRNALIRVPLAWTKENNLAMQFNPQQTNPFEHSEGLQTIELRSPDGSANIHLLLAGIVMAAEWGLVNSKDAMTICDNSYVSVNMNNKPNFMELFDLSTSCAESSEMLLQHRSLFQRDSIFPASAIDYVSDILHKENDKDLNKRLMALPEEERIAESKRIMHKIINKY